MAKNKQHESPQNQEIRSILCKRLLKLPKQINSKAYIFKYIYTFNLFSCYVPMPSKAAGTNGRTLNINFRTETEIEEFWAKNYPETKLYTWVICTGQLERFTALPIKLPTYYQYHSILTFLRQKLLLLFQPIKKKKEKNKKERMNSKAFF